MASLPVGARVHRRSPAPICPPTPGEVLAVLPSKGSSPTLYVVRWADATASIGLYAADQLRADPSR